MTTAYTSLLGLALPVTGELSGTWGDTVNTAITSLLDTAVAGTTSITTDADITLSTTTGASNEARQAIILWNPASGTTTRNITAPAQSKIYTVINASGGTQSIVIRGAGPTTGVTIAKGESATVAWNGSDFVKVGSSGGAITFTNLTVTGNTILGDAAADTLTVNATSTFAAPVSFQALVNLPSTGRSAAAALTPTNPAFLYGVASTYTDTTSSGTIAAVAPFYGLARPTLSTSNVTTYTNAATLYIANSPAAGGSATITNPYALYIAAGNMYFGGSVASNLLFVDNTYDIGASGATRPRTLYLGTSLITPAITNSGLTAGRVTYAGTGGLLTDSANFQFNGTSLSIGIAPTAGVQLYVYAPTSTDAEVRIAVPTATQATYTAYVNTTVTKVGTENSAGGSLASGSSAYATVISNNQGYPVQVGTNNVIRTTVSSAGRYGINTPTPNTTLHVNQLGDSDGITLAFATRGVSRTDWQLSGVTNEGSSFLHNNGTNTQVLLTMTRAEAIFNEDGNDMDFRVESDANTHMLFVDGGLNHVNIGTASDLGGVLNIAGTNTGIAFTYGTTVPNNPLHTAFYGNVTGIGMDQTSAGIRIAGDTGSPLLMDVGWYNTGSVSHANWTSRFVVYQSSVVVNETSADVDFRVESDNRTHMLFVDAGTDQVIMGQSTPRANATLTLSYSGASSGNNAQLSIDANSNSGTGQAVMELLAGSGSTNRASRINFLNGVASTTTPRWTLINDYDQNGTNDLRLVNAATYSMMEFTQSGGVVFNEGSNDLDFRVESDTNTHALFVDAGNSRVGVNNSNPSVPLDVTGIIRIGYQLNQSSPVQNTWYDIIASMVDNASFQVSLFAIKGSNEEFAIYQTLHVIGSLNSSTRTAYYIVGSGSGLEYRILNNFPTPNSMQVRVTASGVSALRASVLQMGG
jgi:hypothetical protein